MVYNSGANECRGEHLASIALAGYKQFECLLPLRSGGSSLKKHWVAYNAGWEKGLAKQCLK